MDRDAFHEILALPEARGYDLNDEQKEAVDYEGGPLWIIAGPGSGKTEVLVTRTLRLMCVGEQIGPRSILLTTFTNKAARSLEDRLASYLVVLQERDPSLKDVDLADLRVGTLHSLCNDILQEFRYPPYQNVRLLDEVEQHLFIHRYALISDCADRAFWNFFDHAVPEWSARAAELPSKWKRAKAAAVLFNRLVEDMVDIEEMRKARGHWATLADLYSDYANKLDRYHRCDFAHLQKRFLSFLESDAGRVFLDGDAKSHLPLLRVLVDEYQDTNPIQERIYLKLASRKPHNISVVGDDDQALYRFRGGTVDCMVNFDKACDREYGIQPHKIPLYKNYRSHEAIVDFFDGYISSLPEMRAAGVRAPRDRGISAESGIAGDYPAVCWLARRQVADLPDAVARLIRDHLIADGVISDLSQCVILMRSTKDSPGNAGPYLAAFRQYGIRVYNPRSKSFMDSEEVQCLLMALVRVIDDEETFRTTRYTDGRKPEWVDVMENWAATLDAVRMDPVVSTGELDDYLARSKTNLPNVCADKAGKFLDLAIPEIVYRILSREPFRTWRSDPAKNQRLAKVTRLLESYHSFNLDNLLVNSTGDGIEPSFRRVFYNTFLRYLIETGIDDDEDEDVIVPQGYLPLMTVHQSKGLEFPIVIVVQLGTSGRLGPAQILEQDLARFRQDPYPRRSRPPQSLVVEDDVRLFYVAYSRAQYALILAATQQQLSGKVSIPGRDITSFRRNTAIIT